MLNRGNYRQWIFNDERAKEVFERTLFEACKRAGWVLHGYCIMSNHYHLALETTDGNLSEGMRGQQKGSGFNNLSWGSKRGQVLSI